METEGIGSVIFFVVFMSTMLFFIAADRQGWFN
jgi:hypothetical protein